MKKLIIRNLKDFLELGFDNQFQILGELEKTVIESNNIQETILIESVVFDLVKIEIDYLKSIKVFTYQYLTTAL